MPAQTLFLILLKMPDCPLSHYYQIKQHSPFGEGLGKPSRCLLVLLQRTSFSHLVSQWAPDLKTESFWNWAKGWLVTDMTFLVLPFIALCLSISQTNQRSPFSGPWTKVCQPPIFINKFLLKHTAAPIYFNIISIFVLWQLILAAILGVNNTPPPKPEVFTV